MSDAALRSCVETDLLAEVLDKVLRRERHVSVRLSSVERRSFPFVSSFPIEELTITLQDGTELDLLFKDVSPRALSAETQSVRPAFLEDPLREIETYRSLLVHSQMGTPLCYGWHIDEATGRYWLFLEKVHGTPLSMVGDFESWKLAAQHLARLHDRLCRQVQTDRFASRVIRHDRAYCAEWLRRAIRFRSAEFASQSPTQERLQRFTGIHPLMLDELLMQTTGVIHGELYASNILIENTHRGVRVCAVDWERTAIGPVLMDVAALTAGNWAEERKLEMLDIYRTERQRLGHDIAKTGDLIRQFDLCRIQLALQWLGWSSDWLPPPEHRQDWLLEAINAARRCGFDVDCKSGDLDRR